tara:strand:- start:24 stop:1571 length:1548 start_codon:yes stop_codon:yes gene_type:complete
MRWLGQHIWDFISRFRNDVYLEDISEVTQDHVVGIDADGKLYKQDVAGGGSGDITAVKFTTDSGAGSPASVASGAANFSLLGTSGVGVTNSSTTITVTSVPGEIDHDSLLNFVAAEHYRWDTDISGTATINTNNITDLHGAGVDGSANQLLTDDGDGSITSESGLTYDGNNFNCDARSNTFSNSGASSPSFTLKNTANDTTGAQFAFLKDKGSAGADGDDIGTILFRGDNAAQETTSFASIIAEISEADDTDEAGKLTLNVTASNGSSSVLSPGLVLEGEHATEGEVDVTIANGAGSTTTIAGTLTMGSTATINNSGVVQVAAQTVIDHDQLANYAANEHFTQANITTVGTIGTGVWQGTAIASAYIADDAVTFAKASGVTPKVFGSVIKLIPSDFMDNGDGGNTKFGVAYTDVAGTGYGMRPPNNATELYAFVSIPEGMKATHVDIFDKNDLAIEVFEAHINATTMTSKGSGNCNTTLDITDVNSSATNFLAIEVTTTSVNDRIYGGTVTIAAQ